tara:strand:+ start:119 stop:568 length:450 start_codon:yes stop_codon:yes gene_type:complete
MKPDINKALVNLAQELIQRFSPLLEDEYEQSRLNSWGTLLLIASMELDKVVENLIEQNKMIKVFLKKYLSNIKDKQLAQDIEFQIKQKGSKYDVSILDEVNQNLRGILVRAHSYFENDRNSVALRECWKILRVMHDHRKVSHLLTLLRN